jgi:hypothetical protein
MKNEPERMRAKDGHGSRGGYSSGWLGSTPAGSLCRLSLCESMPFRRAKADFTLTPAHVTRETRNLNHAQGWTERSYSSFVRHPFSAFDEE